MSSGYGSPARSDSYRGDDVDEVDGIDGADDGPGAGPDVGVVSTGGGALGGGRVGPSGAWLPEQETARKSPKKRLRMAPRYLLGREIARLQTVTIETFLMWIAIGTIAGVLASVVVGGGLGLIGDIVIGVVGAFVGGWIFHALGVHAPLPGLAGTIFVAFIGAVVLLVLLRIIARARIRTLP